MIRVLYVEDDALCREAVADELAAHGFAVQSFADGRSLLAMADATIPADVVVLDWNLPETSGIELLPELRQRGIELPVVFLTGHGEIRHERLAFERGAVDFVDKSRGVAVLARRLKRVVKAAKPPPEAEPDGRLICGRLVLRPSTGRAFWNDADAGLTLGEYNVVRLLISNVCRHVTYRAIYDVLHYAGFVGGAGEQGYRTNVRSVIRHIRQKFRACDPTFDEIENSPAVGYRWGKPDGSQADQSLSG